MRHAVRARLFSRAHMRASKRLTSASLCRAVTVYLQFCVNVCEYLRRNSDVDKSIGHGRIEVSELSFTEPTTRSLRERNDADAGNDHRYAGNPSCR